MLKSESNSVNSRSPFEFRKVDGHWEKRDTRHKRPRWKRVVYPRSE